MDLSDGVVGRDLQPCRDYAPRRASDAHRSAAAALSFSAGILPRLRCIRPRAGCVPTRMSTIAHPRLTRAAVLLAALCAAASAAAHDTWFALQADKAPDSVSLALGTGNRFPLQETGIEAKYLVGSGCRSGSAAVALQPVGDAPHALLLRARASDDQPLTCWAQSSPFEVELTPDKIALYFHDIQASPAVRDAWSQMKARGVSGWKERYTKHARVELNPGAEAAAPVELGMDALLESPAHTPKAGEMLQFRVLRDGQPLPDFAVELRGNRSPVGVWRKTDADGRVRVAAPLAGHWVLRGTDLRVSESDPDRWESRFVTLAFEVSQSAPGRSQAD
jgi:hypothetical protein